MNRCLLAPLLLLSFVLPASAAGVFYSFDTALDGNGTFNGSLANKTVNATANDGFGSASMTYTGTVFSSAMAGGASFQAFTGDTWAGAGNTSTPGHSLAWNPSSTGNSFSMSFSTSTLSSLVIRMDIRAGASSGNNIGGFSSLTYSINGGTPVNVGAALTFTNSTSFQVWTADLSALTGGAINGQDQVTLTWTIGDLSSAQSLRMDNVQIVAVPEPSALGLAGAGCLLVGLRSRRK